MLSGRGSFGDSPLGRSLRELTGRRLREVRPGLREIDPSAWHERATMAVRGLTSGYPAVWALTQGRIVMASSAPQTIATVCHPLSTVAGVAVRRGSQSVNAYAVVDGVPRELTTPTDSRLGELVTAAAAAIRQTVPPDRAVLSTRGPAEGFAGEAVELQVTYVGGGEGLTEGASYRLAVDDGGLHVCPVRGPYEALFLPWSAVDRLRVSSVDEMKQRVDLSSVMLLGLEYALLAGRTTAAIGYLSATTAEAELIFRTSLAPPQLRAQLSRFLVRHEGAGRGAATDLAGALAQVAELHRSGALSDEEFAAAKRRMLADPADQAGG